MTCQGGRSRVQENTALYNASGLHCLLIWSMPLTKISQWDLESQELSSVAREGVEVVGRLKWGPCYSCLFHRVVMKIKWDTRLQENVPVAPDTSSGPNTLNTFMLLGWMNKNSTRHAVRACSMSPVCMALCMAICCQGKYHRVSDPNLQDLEDSLPSSCKSMILCLLNPPTLRRVGVSDAWPPPTFELELPRLNLRTDCQAHSLLRSALGGMTSVLVGPPMLLLVRAVWCKNEVPRALVSCRRDAGIWLCWWSQGMDCPCSLASPRMVRPPGRDDSPSVGGQLQILPLVL